MEKSAAPFIFIKENYHGKEKRQKVQLEKGCSIGGIFAVGVAVGVAGDKAVIKLMVEKGYKTVLKEYRLHVDAVANDKDVVKKVFISITDKLTGKTFGTTWSPADAKEIGEFILQYAEEGLTNG